jgi:aspartyl/asparaginyl beta-hydroxylase (cupin superfamily)
MTTGPGEARAATDAGFAALNRGDFRAASELLASLVAGGAADAAVCFGLSVAHRHLGASAAESEALDEALKRDANYLPALIRKGDLHVGRRDERAASAYYAAALRLAAARPSLPAEWQRELQRIDAALRQINGRFESHLLQALAAHGFDAGAGGRFARALDLLLGKRQIYLQLPKYFYFPELPQIQFYERREFPWVAALEAATGRIRNELCALLASERGFEPYIQKTPDRPNFGNPLLDSLDWSACFLIRDGQEVAANAERCPETLRALRPVPLCRIAGRTPSVLFSVLRPGTRIRPHHGFTNARLVCHLPLIVPGDCALRVGNQTHAWREGELVIFDDSIEHEAWNQSQQLRVVLLFDIWRPELSQQERTLVAATLEAVSGFDGTQRAWTD